ncbi:hypothetical protein O3G_MSEX002771 [Manduca sexta]|uniref:Uncharacterized protein n=1 Tax=Manduca sexta TaxID=7130 RepID=A0A921YPV2_MANSE|nr:hypothetical protein O3G_MSEX002771 [Manduca sexta]
MYNSSRFKIQKTETKTNSYIINKFLLPNLPHYRAESGTPALPTRYDKRREASGAQLSRDHASTEKWRRRALNKHREWWEAPFYIDRYVKNRSHCDKCHVCYTKG